MNPHAKVLLESLDDCAISPSGAWDRLLRMLDRHADTGFGRRHGFASIRTLQDFREAIPPMDYEGYRGWIELATSGEKGTLACDEPVGYERTSGTSSGAKVIPVTAGLQQEFARGMAAWFSGWRARRPEVFNGRAYWALSPPGIRPETTVGGLPLGMDCDAAYFPEEIGSRLSEWLVIPELSGDAGSVFEETAVALLAAPDLSVVSVWSPTFLLGIDTALRRMRGNLTWREMWPGLALVSCWADAASAPWIPRLRERLGGIPIEGKGLLATEGVTSIPDGKDGSPRLASECHWHEFLNCVGDPVEISDLRAGAEYEVVLSTGGGLYRYRSGDRVRVTCMGADGLPRLRFVGRAGLVSDLVGEKLHELQVIEALEVVGASGFLVADAMRPGYDLWLGNPSLAGDFERALRSNPYFDQALALGQLGPLVVRRLEADWNVKLTVALAKHRGCRIGDVKLATIYQREKPEEVAAWLD